MESAERASTVTAPAGGRQTRPTESASSSNQSPSSKERVAERLFDAFSHRDLMSVLALIHPEIVFQPMTAAAVAAGEPYCGHEGIRRYVADVESFWDELILHPVQIRAAGEAVVALGEAKGRSALGSFEGAPTTWVLKFRDGLVIHAQIFSDGEDVRRTLGTDG